MKEVTEREATLAALLMDVGKEALELDFGPLETHTEEAFEIECAALVAILRVSLNLPVVKLHRVSEDDPNR